MKLNQKNIPALLCLGDIYIERKNLEKAERCFRKVLVFDKNNQKAFEALDDIHWQKRQILIERSELEQQK